MTKLSTIGVEEYRNNVLPEKHLLYLLVIAFKHHSKSSMTDKVLLVIHKVPNVFSHARYHGQGQKRNRNERQMNWSLQLTVAEHNLNGVFSSFGAVSNNGRFCPKQRNVTIIPCNLISPLHIENSSN